MIGRNFVEEDFELKRYAHTPKDSKPRFDWRGVTPNADAPLRDFKVRVGDTTQDFDLAEIAETIGDALTDLHLSRKQDEILSRITDTRFHPAF